MQTWSWTSLAAESACEHGTRGAGVRLMLHLAVSKAWLVYGAAQNPWPPEDRPGSPSHGITTQHGFCRRRNEGHTSGVSAYLRSLLSTRELRPATLGAWLDSAEGLGSASPMLAAMRGEADASSAWGPGAIRSEATPELCCPRVFASAALHSTRG